ncbi:MAG: YegP family protein [Bacteroidales bacterium]
MGKYIIQKSSNGGYFFNLKAGNNETILTSEIYNTKKACQDGIESVRNNSPIDSRYERKTSSNSKFYFNLKASNGQVIGTSEMYETSGGMETGINSVKQNGPNSPIEDRS